MNKIISAIAVIVVAVAAVVIVYTLKDDKGRSEHIISVESIRSIMQLAVVDYYVSDHLTRTKGKKWYEWKEASFIVHVAGDIKGSIDLQRVDVNVDQANKKVKIRVPESAVLISNLEVDRESIRLVECSNPNIFHPITGKDFEMAQKDIIDLLRATAMNKGIIERTRTEARSALTNFLRGFGYELDIVFEG